MFKNTYNNENNNNSKALINKSTPIPIPANNSKKKNLSHEFNQDMNNPFNSASPNYFMTKLQIRLSKFDHINY